MKKALIIISGLLFLLVAAAWTYVQSDSFGLRIRPLIAGPLQEVLGPGADFGKVKTNLVPPYLEVRNIVIPSDRDPHAILIRRIRVYINPLPLIYRTLSLSSILIQEPRVTCKRDQDGSIDLEQLITRIRKNMEEAASRGAPSWTVRIGSITIRNGSVRFSDNDSGAILFLTKLNLRARLGASGTTGNARITSATLSLSLKSQPTITAEVRAAGIYQSNEVTITNADLVSDVGRLSLRGTVGTVRDLPVNLKVSASWDKRQSLIKSLLKPRQKRSFTADVEATITGTAKDPQAEGLIRFNNADYGGVTVPQGSLSIGYHAYHVTVSAENWDVLRGSRKALLEKLVLSLTYRAGGLDMHEARALFSDGEMSGTGRVDPEMGYNLTLIARSTGPGTMLALAAGMDLPGSIAVHGTLAGDFKQPRFSGTLTAGPLTVRGIQFKSLSGLVQLEERKLSLQGATIRHGSSQYLFDGSVDFSGPEPFYEARLNVISSDVVSIVALFYQKIPLEMTANGELTFRGTTKEFTGRGHLAFGSGSAYGEPFERGSIEAILDKDMISFPEVVIEKKGGSVQGTGWIAFNGTYGAQLKGSGIDLSDIPHIAGLDLAGPVSLELESSGPFSAPVVRGHAAADALRFHDALLGSLESDLALASGELRLTASFRTGEDAPSTFGVTLRTADPYPWALTADIHRHNFDPSSIIRNNEILSKMRLNADGKIHARGSLKPGSTVIGSAVFSQLDLVFGDYHLQNDGDLRLRYEEGTVTVQSAVLSGTGTRLSVTGGLHPGKDLDLTLSGDANLSLLRLLYREIEHGDGTAALKLTVKEAWSNPDVAGDLTLNNGLIKIKDIPQKFSNLSGTITFDRNRIVTEGVSGEFGGGTITASGSARLEGTTLLDFSTRMVFDNVTVRYPAGLTATLGGTLYYDGDPARQALTGEIAIKRARYEKRVEWKSMLVDFSRGFTQKKKADIGWIGETQINLRFFGRNDIVLESNLGKIPLEIDMLLRGTVNQPQVLGRVEARKGEVYFRQNVFHILHASADFADPNRINPTLDVQAETKVREYQIRLSVSGTADRAVVSFISDPPLTDSNILAMLALGKTGAE
nr:translocation/assembly module TamB domain-containing protein [Nitrospiraceae bacterium]